jgi:hypothetical protein
MYALVVNGVVTRYPYTGTDLIRDTPNTSFPNGVLSDATLASWGVLPVQPSPSPAYNPLTQKLVEVTPIKIASNWTQQWTVAALSPSEMATAQTALQDSIVDATQLRLDTFAQTRNYMGILSASTYATSNVAKFKTEGQYCVNQRDATWAMLYEILAAVQSGARPMPTGYADIEAELPVLVWP